LIGTVILSAALGCTKPKETTAVSAATGGAIGAGLGAIIGNQTGDAGSGLAIGAVAGAATGALIGNALQAQQESVRSQDEAIERQERMIAAQRTEIAELRNLNPDIVEQKRLALQKRGPSPYSSRSVSTSMPGSLSRNSSDPLARLNMSSQSLSERSLSTTNVKAAPVLASERYNRPTSTQPKNVKVHDEQTPAKQVVADSDSSDSCAEAEKDRTAAQNAMDSSDKLFHLRRALRLCPNNARMHHELGKVYVAMDRRNDAELEFKQALDVDPSYAPAKQSLDHIASENIKF
jgi:tetratricopeptide (TPR) repeat protein